MNVSPDMNRDPNFQPPPGPQAGDGPATAEASIGVLLKELAHEVPALLSNEVTLAKSEARESLRAAQAGVAAVATGGAVLLAGVIVLMLSAVYALSLVVAPWLAALIVGAVVTLAGVGLLQAGKKKFGARALRPEHTINSLQKDKDAFRGRLQ